MRLSFGKDGHLRYDENYAVLICLACQYAVQKNAVESHLLRHKIYRGERRQLLATISQLHLTEPDRVPSPPTVSGPIDGLAILPGYRCSANGCEALCASAKRMRRHWSETHGTTDAPTSSLASEVHLQTFFRGTKLRYFQVSVRDHRPQQKPAANRQRSSPSAPREAGGDAIFAVAQVSQPPAAAVAAPLQLEMEILQYFHHYTTATSLTLPNTVDRDISYWQKNILSRALQLRWLMCGVLAVTATHKSTLVRDADLRNLHGERALQFRTEFLATWPTQQGSAIEASAIEIGAQLRCIQRLCQMTWPAPLSSSPEQRLGRLEWGLLSQTIRGCLDPAVALLTAPQPFYGATARPGSGARSKVLAASVTNKAPPTLLKSLRELPFRMAVALSKPDSHADLVSVVSAIEILTDCFVLSYSCDHDGGRAAWLGMECWLQEVPEHFNEMLSDKVPAALIVLAHWCLLVKRTESYYWFMQGLEEKVVQGILNQVPDDASIRQLVEACRGSLV